MNKVDWEKLKEAKISAQILLDLIKEQIKRAACKNCGGSGSVALSREPCSTSEIDCHVCRGEGFNA